MCFGLGGYFMAAVLAAASYSRIGFSLYFAVHAWRVRVPGGIKFHLEPGTISPSITYWQKHHFYLVQYKTFPSLFIQVHQNFSMFIISIETFHSSISLGFTSLKNIHTDNPPKIASKKLIHLIVTRNWL